jgi:hypothetical protein
MGVTPRSLVAVLTVALAAAAAPAPASAQDQPPFVDWSSLLPAGPNGEYQPSSADDCVAGRLRCVDAVIREMTRRFDRLADSCDHDAVFALAYLRTTEEYRRATTTPGFFEDPPFVNHEDAVFAAIYFTAFDAFHSGWTAGAPPAWAIAFRAAQNREVSGTGNLLLGMNAHVQRDLPFVLAAIGLVKPDGTSRKTDHDRVNRFLNNVPAVLIPEIARRFDSSVDDTQLPTPLDDFISFQMLPAWREMAWRNAERLVGAPGALAKALVARDIEAYAASQAELLRQATAYPPGQTSAARDAYCAVNHG